MSCGLLRVVTPLATGSDATRFFKSAHLVARNLRTQSRLRAEAKPKPAAEPAPQGTPYSKLSIGVPKEVWQNEKRVAVTPAVTAAFVKKGFAVHVEAGAGVEAKFRDDDYAAAGALVGDKKSVFMSGEFLNLLKFKLQTKYRSLVQRLFFPFTFFFLKFQFESFP